MSLDRVAMALDDVIKEDRKANKSKNRKGAGKAVNNNTKKVARGIKKRNTSRKPRGTPGQDPATANLVKKLVKKALVQNGVVTKIKPVQRSRAQKNKNPKTTVVRQIVRKVVSNNTPSSRGRLNRRVVRQVEKPFGLNQRSRTIVRRVIEAPPRRQHQQNVVREVRYVRDPVSRRSDRVVRHVVPKPRQRLVVVNEPPRARYGSVYSRSSRRLTRRSIDPFYDPKNYLQRY